MAILPVDVDQNKKIHRNIAVRSKMTYKHSSTADKCTCLDRNYGNRFNRSKDRVCQNDHVRLSFIHTLLSIRMHFSYENTLKYDTSHKVISNQ